MAYTEQEKKEIERVIEVFQDVLKTRKDVNGNSIMDILWSESMGVYYFAFYEDKGVFERRYRAESIRDGRHLFWMLSQLIVDETRDEWYKDFLRKIDRSSLYMRIELRDKMKDSMLPYVGALPEYEYAVDEVVKDRAYVNVKWGLNDL